METFADDGTNLNDVVYEGYNHRLDGIISMLGTEEDSERSIADSIIRVTPSPANTETALLRRDGASRLDFQTPDNIPLTDHSESESGEEGHK